jgi:hypothetical protein
MGGFGGSRLRWGGVVLTSLAGASWAFLGMAGVAALGLHLIGADRTASLGPMTAAVVAMAVGGSVSPSGKVSAFGMSSAGARGHIDIVPLGVGLVGALLLAWVFLRSLRLVRSVGGAELVARVVCTAVVFLAVLGGLSWAGHDTVAIDGGSLDGGAGKGAAGVLDKIPGIGSVGGGKGLVDGLQGLAKTKSTIGFHVNTGSTLLGGLLWVLGVLVIALLASRRTVLPHGWGFVQRSVRPAVSALVTMLLVTVVAGAAAGLYAAATGDEPGRIAGGVLLGTPNGAWLAVPLGLFVPWHGKATGPLTGFLPDPMDKLLAGGSGKTITLSGLADLDGRVWLLPVAVVLLMLTAGVLNAANAPIPPGGRPPAVRMAAGAAVRLGVASAVAMPLLAWLTGVSVNANMSVFGVDAVGAGLRLDGQLGLAVLLGAVWGAGTGFVGALLFTAVGGGRERAGARRKEEPGPYHPAPAYRPEAAEPNPYRDTPVAAPPAAPAPTAPPPPAGAAGPYRGMSAPRPADANPYRDAPGPRHGDPARPDSRPPAPRASGAHDAPTMGDGQGPYRDR